MIFLKKLCGDIWKKSKPVLRDPIWQGIGVLVAIISIFLMIILANISNKPSQAPEVTSQVITAPSFTVSPTTNTPVVTVQPTKETTVVPLVTRDPISEEETIIISQPTSLSPTSTSTPCLTDQWKQYPISYWPLVRKDSNGCLDFKEFRFSLDDKTLTMYANPVSNTGTMGIYTTIPDNEWHKVFEIQVNQLEAREDGMKNRFIFGFFYPTDTNLIGKFLEIYSTSPGWIIGRTFAGDPINQEIKIKSKVVVDCEITDLRKTTCSITIDEGPAQVFENVLQDGQFSHALFIGYSVYKGSTVEITITDLNDESIFQ